MEKLSIRSCVVCRTWKPKAAMEEVGISGESYEETRGYVCKEPCYADLAKIQKECDDKKKPMYGMEKKPKA